MPSSTKPPRSTKPAWLRQRLPSGPEYEAVRRVVTDHGLNTVCREAACPNQFACYGEGTATFMILGERCTRNCRFCAVEHGPEAPPDPGEPERVAAAVARLGLRYAVITSVTRDDLADGGAGLFAATIRAIRRHNPTGRIEVLIPDLLGDSDALATILEAGPEVLNHNLETVPSLYPLVRPGAVYLRSLSLLRRARQRAPGIPTKSGLMLGLGEERGELEQVWADLLAAGCTILTMGQYLQPSRAHLPVKRFVPPEEFAELGELALKMGFAGVASGPFVRSSFRAEELYLRAQGHS